MSIQAAATAPRTWTIIVWSPYLVAACILFLLGAFGLPRQLFYFVEFVGVTAVLSGVIVAHLKRRDLAGSPFETHMISAVRTFWIGLLAFLVGLGLLLLIYWPAGIALIYVAPPVLAVWLLFRSIRGLIRAVDGRPVDNPAGFL